MSRVYFKPETQSAIFTQKMLRKRQPLLVRLFWYFKKGDMVCSVDGTTVVWCIRKEFFGKTYFRVILEDQRGYSSKD